MYLKTTILTIIFCGIIAIASGQEVNSYYASDGEAIYYTEYGDGPTVVLLYGGPGYAVSAMKFWADSLSSDFKCILFDQRGTGHSSNVKFDKSTINLQRAVQDLEELRLHMNEGKLILCGISWGGMLAQAYAAHYPNNTSKIILVSTLGPDMSTMQAFTDNMNMRRFPDERDSLEFWQNQSTDSYSSMKRSYYSFIPEFYNHETGHKMLPVFFATTTYNNKMGNLMYRDLYENYDLNNSLPDYKGECIIIRSRQDPVPAEAVYRIKDLLPQTRIKIIEKCGHFPDYEKPEEFFKILKEVL